jgi:hypothetical protein
MKRSGRRLIIIRGDRSPRDGKPYYCTVCGYGLPEYLACESPACRLETYAEAEARIVRIRLATQRRLR